MLWEHICQTILVLDMIRSIKNLRVNLSGENRHGDETIIKFLLVYFLEQ